MAQNRRWWQWIDASYIRELIFQSNDGIMAVAGMALGLIGADVSMLTAVAVVAISTAAGALSIFGTRMGEAFAEREAELATVEDEERLLKLSPEEEVQELADWFEEKGVTQETSLAVAEELSAADALGAQLELEYGLKGVTSVGQAWTISILSAVAFLLGAAVPLLISYLVPWSWRDDYTVLATVLALTLTSMALALFGKSRFWPTVLRTLTIGLATLAITYFLGDWLI